MLLRSVWLFSSAFHRRAPVAKLSGRFWSKPTCGASRGVHRASPPEQLEGILFPSIPGPSLHWSRLWLEINLKKTGEFTFTYMRGVWPWVWKAAAQSERDRLRLEGKVGIWGESSCRKYTALRGESCLKRFLGNFAMLWQQSFPFVASSKNFHKFSFKALMWDSFSFQMNQTLIIFENKNA